MHAVNTSYSCTPRCDTRTGLSIGLSLLAALVTAVVLGVLAYKGYVSSTIAYSAAPSIGAALLLIGIAIALIRMKEQIEPFPTHPLYTPATALPEDNIPPSPIEIQKALASPETLIGLTVDLDYPTIHYYPPDEHHLNAYFTAPISFIINGKQAWIHVEIVEIVDTTGVKDCVDLTFAYQNIRYQKQAKVGLINPPSSTCLSLASLISCSWDHYRGSFLSKREYTSLTTITDPSTHTETLFMIGRSWGGKSGLNTVTATFHIPNVEMTCIEKGNVAVFTRSKSAEPVRSLQGLENQPELTKKLKATEWKWTAPYPIKTINVENGFCEVIYEKEDEDSQ